MLTVKQIFELGLEKGIAADPRGVAGVKKYLARIKRASEDLSAKEKEYFDKQALTNPYMDSLIHVDDGKTRVKRVLAGIDITETEILLATQLNERGQKIDLVMAHHPLGFARASLPAVMDMQVSFFESHGVPVHLAEKVMEERIKEVGRGVHPTNHYKAIDVANLLQVNLMNTHTITDNLVTTYLDKFLAGKDMETIKDLLEVLLEIPEYHQAKMMGFGPKIFAGAPNHRIGKYVVEMTGGTNPSNKVYEQLSQAGVSTIIGMHMGEGGVEKINENLMNVVVAGHMASDSLGMNLFLDELEKKGIEIVPCGGLIRVSRVKKK